MDKINIESNYELDLTNCDVSMTSYLNFVTDKPKISCSCPNYGLINLKFSTGVNTELLISSLNLKIKTSKF